VVTCVSVALHPLIIMHPLLQLETRMARQGRARQQRCRGHS